MRGYKFFGRSWEKDCFEYSLFYKVVMKLNYILKPLIILTLVSDRLYTYYYRLIGVKVGKNSFIRRGTYINDPRAVVIGENCSIHGELKSRGGITICDNVELVQDVLLSTQSHNVESDLFESVYAPVYINSYSWIGPRAIILPGVVLSEGSVVGASSVITKPTKPWTVYAGIPGVEIKQRIPLKRDF